MAQYGVVICVGLLILVTAVTFAISAQATKSIAQFRQEHHESFMRKDPL